MSTTKLKLYNNALVVHLGERKLSSLTENREPRRALDDVWDNGAVDYCLQQGLWNFASRSVMIDYDPDVTPDFGFDYAFTIPTDFIRIIKITSDEDMKSSIQDYKEERGYWFTNHQTIYVEYISNDSSYGGDLSRWPETFTKFVEAHLAQRICKRITNSVADSEDLEKVVRKKLVDARSKDAMDEGTKFAPRGSWSTARTGRASRYRDDNGYGV